MTAPADNRLQARNDLAWAISVGGIGVVLFAALLLFTWYFAATLFLIFAGMLLGVALNAMTNLLGRVVRLPHALRLTIVCLALAGMLSGVVFLGGTTIAQQTTALSNTIKSQLVNVKAFLEKKRRRHQPVRFRKPVVAAPDSSAPAAPGAAPTHYLPSAGTHCLERRRDLQPDLQADPRHRRARSEISSSCCFWVSLSRQPSVYRNGLLFMAPAKHRGARHRRSSTASARRWSAG